MILLYINHYLTMIGVNVISNLHSLLTLFRLKLRAKTLRSYKTASIKSCRNLLITSERTRR